MSYINFSIVIYDNRGYIKTLITIHFDFILQR